MLPTYSAVGKDSCKCTLLVSLWTGKRSWPACTSWSLRQHSQPQSAKAHSLSPCQKKNLFLYNYYFNIDNEFVSVHVLESNIETLFTNKLINFPSCVKICNVFSVKGRFLTFTTPPRCAHVYNIWKVVVFLNSPTKLFTRFGLLRERSWQKCTLWSHGVMRTGWQDLGPGKCSLETLHGSGAVSSTQKPYWNRY